LGIVSPYMDIFTEVRTVFAAYQVKRFTAADLGWELASYFATSHPEPGAVVGGFHFLTYPGYP